MYWICVGLTTYRKDALVEKIQRLENQCPDQMSLSVCQMYTLCQRGTGKNDKTEKKEMILDIP